MSQPTRLLVASIGNPAPYLNTLHSAGHTVLHSLARSLAAPPFTKSRPHGNGLLTSVPAANLTLWQSPSLMNISGAALSAAWKQFARDTHGADVALVVLHDELESPLGTVKVKGGGASARGHNGLKSIKEVMGSVAYTRVGVGIGRPSSRESGEVARYVLRKMTGVERAALEGCVGRVEEELARLAGL